MTLLERAVNGDAPVYHASGAVQKSSQTKSGGSVGHKIYTQLMNGVSHMLPFVVGGGILIAIAFLIDGFMVDMNSLPVDQRADFGTITPVQLCLKVSAVQHLASCFRYWQDLLPWRSVTGRPLRLALWAE
ncbi:MAG: hypothetical protein V8Q57_00675 [Blautia sp.]